MALFRDPDNPARRKRYERDYDFLELMIDEGIRAKASNTFIDATLGRLCEPLANALVVDNGAIIAELREAGMCALRRIVTAWNKYPVIGSDYNTTKTSAYDFRNTALHVVRSKPQGSVEKQIAKIMADAVDPSDEDETFQQTQTRINNLILAAKKQWCVFADAMLDDGSRDEYEDVQLEWSEDEADTVTYHMQQGSNTLNPPSTPSNLLQQAADVDNELDDRQIIYASGKVLRNKAEKISYAANERAATRMTASASRVRFADMESSEAGSSGLASTTTPSSKKQTPSKKRSAGKSDQSTPSKRQKGSKVAGVSGSGKKGNSPSKSTSQDVEEGDSDDEVDSPLSIAPDNTKSGGAAKPWLRDEDDWGHHAIIEHPEWQMPTIYREFNQRFANTAYQEANMLKHEYRGDYLRFPTDNPNKDNKKSRDYDLFHRSYQSVRQHFEKFKREVSDPKTHPPYKWTPFPENLAADLPARSPPPRPDVFRDPDHTPVPRIGDEDQMDFQSTPRARTAGPAAQMLSGASSASPSEMAAQNRAATTVSATTGGAVNTFDGEQYQVARGWTPINAPVSGNFNPYRPPTPRRGDRAAAERAAGLISTIDPRARVDMTAPQNFASRGRADKGKTTTFDLPDRTKLIFLDPETPETMRNSGAKKGGRGAQKQAEARSSPESAPGDALVDTIEDFVAQQSDGEGDVGMEDADQGSGERSTAVDAPVSLPAASSSAAPYYGHPIPRTFTFPRREYPRHTYGGNFTGFGRNFTSPVMGSSDASRAGPPSPSHNYSGSIPPRRTTGRAITMRPKNSSNTSNTSPPSPSEQRDGDTASMQRRQN